jgi:hypothetical protein
MKQQATPRQFFPISQNLFLFFIYFDPNLKEKKKKKPLMCREREAQPS